MAFTREKVISAVDISDGFVKVAAVTGEKGKEKLCAMDYAPLESDTDKEAARGVRSLISRNKLGKSPVLVSFPRHLVTIRNVQLPTADEEEVKNMAELQAAKHLPYSPEEIVVAHKTIGVTPDGYTDILLILAQRKSVDRYVEIFKHAGIHIEKLALSSEGVRNWYTKLNVDDTQPVALIDFDKYHAHILIFKRKALLFSRSVSFDITDADSDRNVLLREIRLSFDSYMKEKDENISRIILTGSEDYSKDFSSFLEENVSMPCEHSVQSAAVAVKAATEELSRQFKNASYTHLLGIAALPEELAVDLLPRDIVDRRREENAKSELIKTTALFLAAVVAAFGIMEKKMAEKRSYLQKIEKRLEKIEPEVKRLSRLKDNIELIRGQLTFSGSSVDIIREIYEILPKNISLTLFEFDDGNRILLRGAAKELSEVFNLLPLLEKSPHFKNVKINYTTKRTFKNREFADFEIVCALR